MHFPQLDLFIFAVKAYAPCITKNMTEGAQVKQWLRFSRNKHVLFFLWTPSGMNTSPPGKLYHVHFIFLWQQNYIKSDLKILNQIFHSSAKNWLA